MKKDHLASIPSSRPTKRFSSSLWGQEPLTPHPSCGSNVAGDKSLTRASPQQAAQQELVNQGSAWGKKCVAAAAIM